MNIHRTSTDDTPIELLINTNYPGDITQLPVQVAYMGEADEPGPGDWVAASWNAAGHVQTAGPLDLGLTEGIYEPSVLLNGQVITASGRVIIRA